MSLEEEIKSLEVVGNYQ